MKRMTLLDLVRSVTRLICIIAAGVVMGVTLSGCVVAGGSSRGGWFIWPGGFGLLLLILIVLFVLRRR